VTDTLIESNAGRWKLIASAFDGSSGSRTPIVERTDETPDITLDIRDLGAVYLGGTSLSSLASAGLVRAVNPRALATASTAFGWPHAPMSSWVF
jgi:predicted acetyltransferase